MPSQQPPAALIPTLERRAPRSSRGLVVRALALAAGLGIGASTALAQAELPASLLSSASALTAEQSAQIETYVKPHLESLRADDAERVNRARRALILPLTRSGVGVAFRQAYARQVGVSLAQVSGGTSVINAVNALRVAAELSTEEGFDIVEKAYAAPDPAVRLAAAAATARAFEVAGRAGAAVVPARLRSATTRLGAMLAPNAEANPDVTDTVARALIVAMQTSPHAEVRNEATLVLTRGLVERARAIKGAAASPRLLDAVLRTGLAIRDDLTNVSGARPPLSAEATRGVHELAGELIALGARQIRGGELAAIRQADSPEERKAKEQARSVLSQVVGAGEQILSLSASSGDPVRTDMASLVRRASTESDAKFLEDARALLGAGGRLTKPPFNLPGDRFDMGR